MMLVCAGASAVAVMLMLSFYILLEGHLTRKRLDKHQRVWDAIKAELMEKGSTQEEIDDAYICYVDELMLNRHTLLGACLPRR